VNSKAERPSAQGKGAKTETDKASQQHGEGGSSGERFKANSDCRAALDEHQDEADFETRSPLRHTLILCVCEALGGCLVGAIPGTYAGERSTVPKTNQAHMTTTQIDVHALAAELAALIADRQAPPGLLDAEAAAELLNVPASWVLAEARANRIPTVRLGRYVRFRRDDLQAWIERRAAR
jgi:excisionase family DNA binding protein